ncbi:hypothetical protein BJY01DRAFT_251787 [Aspergillus pseudoustus]|uniref:SWIM-type domain-containing protein n=1 Tax=Aspergillus pseudoustus TaxID=1810923 RepID=A0ABR4J9U7_9EURO
MSTGIKPSTSIYNGVHGRDLPHTTRFINDLLSKLAKYTTASTAPSEIGELNEDGHRHHHKPTSTFPSPQPYELKPLMLTLHCIFPNEFLLALDIIDRGLVRRITAEDQIMPPNQEIEHPEAKPQERIKDNASTRKEDFFFVTSASTTSNYSSLSTTQLPPHQLNRWQTKGYEVRLQAWNCSCPAFTLSIFRNLGHEPSSPLSPSPEIPSPDVNERGNGESSSPTSDHAGEAGADADADAGADDAVAYSFGGTLPLHPESAPAVCKHILACLLTAVCPGLGGEGRGGGQFVTLGMEEVAALCAGWGG